MIASIITVSSRIDAPVRFRNDEQNPAIQSPIAPPAPNCRSPVSKTLDASESRAATQPTSSVAPTSFV